MQFGSQLAALCVQMPANETLKNEAECSRAQRAQRHNLKIVVELTKLAHFFQLIVLNNKQQLKLCAQRIDGGA